MKSLLNSVLFFGWMFSALALHAQKPKLGLYAELNAGSAISWKYVQPGIRGGLSLQVPISPTTAIRTEAGVNLIRDKAKYEAVISANEQVRATSTNAYNYAEISPVMIFRQDKKLNLLGGAYLAALLSRQGFTYEIRTLNNTSRLYTYDRSGRGIFNTLDYGLRAGLAYRIQPGVTVQLMYSQGLRSVLAIRPVDYAYHVRGIFGGVHVNFGKQAAASAPGSF